MADFSKEYDFYKKSGYEAVMSNLDEEHKIISDKKHIFSVLELIDFLAKLINEGALTEDMEIISISVVDMVQKYLYLDIIKDNVVPAYKFDKNGQRIAPHEKIIEMEKSINQHLVQQSLLTQPQQFKLSIASLKNIQNALLNDELQISLEKLLLAKEVGENEEININRAHVNKSKI